MTNSKHRDRRTPRSPGNDMAARLLDALTGPIDLPVLAVDWSGRIIRCNTKLEQMLGYPADSLPPLPFEQLVAPTSDINLQARNHGYLGNAGSHWDEPLTVRLRCRDGSEVPASLTVLPLSLTDKPVCLYLVSDERQPLDNEAVLASEHAQQAAATPSPNAKKRQSGSQEHSRLRAFYEQSMDAALITDASGQILDANPAAASLFGHEEGKLRQMHRDEIFANDPDFRSAIGEMNKEGHYHGELLARRSDGTEFPADVLCTRYASEDNAEFSSLVVRDISDSKRATEALQAIATGAVSGSGESFFRLLVRQLAIAMRVHHVLIAELSDGDPETLTILAAWPGKKGNDELEILAPGSPCENIFTKKLVHVRSGARKRFPESRMLAELQAESITAIPLVSSEGRPLGILAAVHDQPLKDKQASELPSLIAIFATRVETELERIHDQKILSYEATHDHLSDLINRREFERRLRRLLNESRSGEEHALLYIDLDQFKQINDSCGHAAGDRMLRELAELMNQNVRGSDTLARVGGDEFSVILQSCTLDNAVELADKLLETISTYRFTEFDHTFTANASIGLVHFRGGEAITATELLQQADLACYTAKQRGRGQTQLFHGEQHKLGDDDSHGDWPERLRRAVVENRFQLFRQEIRAVEDDDSTLYELLLRLQEDTGELILPARFIPVAERLRMMPKVDRWVIENAFRWLGNNPTNSARYTINLSSASLEDPDIMPFIEEQLRIHHVNPENVAFEISEAAVMSHFSRTSAFLMSARKMGFMMVLDGFGSGLSSFTHLKKLPFDLIKIDGTFIRELDRTDNNLTIVKGMYQLGRSLGIRTIAAYVERPAILDIIRNVGIEHVQGFAVHKPEPLDGLPADTPRLH